jgi:hypothetical protein
MMSSIKWTASALSLALVGCSSDPATFITYANQGGTTNAAVDVTKSPPLTDAVALNYANSVECIFRARATGARYTREASDTALAGLAAATAAAGTFSYGTSTVAALGLSSGGIVQLRNIFNAGARANAYADAAARLHAAIKDYVAYNLNGVSETALTPNGWTLVNVVQANIDMVDKVLNGHLPSAQDLAQATEPMHPTGAKPQAPGTTPINNISASGVVPQKTGPVITSEAVPKGFIVGQTLADQKRDIGAILRKLTPEQAAAALAIVDPNAQPVSAADARARLAERLLDATTRADLDRIEEAVKKARSGSRPTDNVEKDLSAMRRQLAAKLRTITAEQAETALTILKPGERPVPSDQAKEQLAAALFDAQTTDQMQEIEKAIKQAQTGAGNN